MKSIKKCLVFAATLLLLHFVAYPQSTVKSLEKIHSSTIKDLKKRYNLKSVDIRIEEDGTWYYLLKKKVKDYEGSVDKLGIANKHGKVIVPAEYMDVRYFPAAEEGVSKIPCYAIKKYQDLQQKYRMDKYIPASELDAIRSGFLPLYHAKTEAVFLCYMNDQKESAIINVDGKVLNEGIKGELDFIPNYFISGARSIVGYAMDGTDIFFLPISGGGRRLMMYSVDGKIIVDGAISITIAKCGYACTYAKKASDGLESEGGLLLNDASSSVPCMFNHVYYDDKHAQWKVRKAANSEDEVYNGENGDGRFRDKGEEYFEKRMYDEVIEFYSSEGISASWAKFFTAASLSNKALEHVASAEMLSKYIEDDNMYLFDVFSKKGFDLSLATQLLNTSDDVLNAYMQEDSIYGKQADFYKSMNASYRERMPQIQTRYDNAVKLLERRKEAERLAAIRRQQEANERAVQTMTAILSGFINAISSSSHSGHNRSHTVSGRSGGSTVSSASRTSSSGSSSSQSGTTTRYRDCLKCKGTGDIFTTSSVASYGNDKKVVCPTCGKEHWASTVHHHKKCDNCKGSGKVAY